MIGTLAEDLGSGYWLCEVRDQTRRVWMDPLEFASPWWVPEVGDRVVLQVHTTGLTVVGVLGKGVPSAARSA